MCEKAKYLLNGVFLILTSACQVSLGLNQRIFNLLRHVEFCGQDRRWVTTLMGSCRRILCIQTSAVRWLQTRRKHGNHCLWCGRLRWSVMVCETDHRNTPGHNHSKKRTRQHFNAHFSLLKPLVCCSGQVLEILNGPVPGCSTPYC